MISFTFVTFLMGVYGLRISENTRRLLSMLLFVGVLGVVLASFVVHPAFILQLLPDLSVRAVDYSIDSTQLYAANNLQKILSFRIGIDLFADNPVLGIGTNGYVDFIDQHYYWLPDALRMGIHGEFLRVLVENGIIGNGYAFHSSGLVRVSTTAELATRLLYGAGLVATACCARRWNSSPRAPGLRRLNRNVNSSR